MKRYRDYSEDDIRFIFSQQPPQEVDPFINYVKKVKARFQHDQPEKKIRTLIRIAEDAIISEAAPDGVVLGWRIDAPQDFQARMKAILGGCNDLIDGYNSLMPSCHQISLDDVEEKETGEGKKTGFQDAMDFLNKSRIACGEDGSEEFMDDLSLFKEGHPDLLDDVLKCMPLFEAKPLAYHLPDLQSADLTSGGVVEQERSGPGNIEVRETQIVRADGSEESVCSLDDEEKDDTVADTESKRNRFREAMDFVNKLRIKLGEDDYEEFLKIFRFYKGSKNWADVCDSGLSLTEGHPDLQEEFLKFMGITEAKPLSYRLPDLQSSDLNNSTRVDELQRRAPENRKVRQKTDQERKSVGANGPDSISEQIREGVSFLEKVRKSLSCEVRYMKFLKLFFAYSRGKAEKAELENMVSSLIGNYPDLMSEFLQFLKNCESLGAVEITPGYRIIPEENRNTKKRHESQVLNDEVMSVSSKLRGNSFKNRRINQYENNLFECEDEQFEVDMLLEWFKSAETYARNLGGVTCENEEKNGSAIIFERCIERLYGDQGVEVLDIFHNDPMHALPILRTHLQQKKAELTEYRECQKSRWIEVYSRNHHKSLRRC
ncbi:hypothetical protein DKX38_026797 [Salix brachista]|uniref:Histone deacetylase interacting domain-containing protein n=1 Tax=Salix brachista TaxID=2182728 RepID=A0A5N5JAE0_9ROSI|nr:hypothetical protein DKX38_026797 [Salix brachista]